jgi:3-deoxy-7-phosphoheptulonate synthase
MIIVMKAGTPEAEIDRLDEDLRTNWGLIPEKIVGRYKVVMGLVGETAELEPLQLREMSTWIEEVLRVEKPYKRASIEYRQGEASEVPVATPLGTVMIGLHHPIAIVAGPCSVENEEMIVETAMRVKAAGAHFLRGGAYKPRTSPYAFQGHGESALGLLAAARDLSAIAEVADVIQVGARNMQNFSLLKKVGAQDKPILLKRGISATIEEWLMAAEYIMASGNPNVILCERGIRGYDRQYTRNTLDLSAVPVLRTLTHLPIMVDPSHGTGWAQFVPSMAFASIASGTDSLMIEVHPNPKKALSDGPQSLTPDQFDKLMEELAVIGKVMGRWPQPVPVLA